MTGIYIHVPFCMKKCPYCSFYSLTGCEEKIPQYVNALIRSIRSYKPERIEADTIYFGGGTPSLLPPCEIKRIIAAIRSSFAVSDDCEITLEANPHFLADSDFKDYVRAGINRVSFGVQSASDAELKRLGRLHDFESAKRAVVSAQSAGIKNISCDLMIGTPDQTVSSLLDSCDSLLRLNVSHISAYMLKIEKGTPFDCEQIKKSVADDDMVADMYLALCERLESAGFQRYEISNFAVPGFESRHNLKYWRCEPYLGFGPSAHSYFGGKRFYVPSDLDLYLSSALQPVVAEDDNPDMLEEYVMLSLRLKEGMSLERLSELGGNASAVEKKIKRFENAGLLTNRNKILSLTDRGCMVSNGLILEIYLAAIGENQ